MKTSINGVKNILSLYNINILEFYCTLQIYTTELNFVFPPLIDINENASLGVGTGLQV